MTYNYDRRASMPGLDPDEEKLYDVLWMIASNDGDSYRKKDAAGAVTKAWREYQRDHAEELRESFGSIQKLLVKELAKRWAKGEV
jgi:hypothetical protein